MEDVLYASEREQMVETQIVRRGVRDVRVLEAMRAVPRHFFVAPEYRYLAYTDGPLPIGNGQTISQPYIVALMSELLALQGDEKVLEIGTGSGYQAAVLAHLAREVHTIERYTNLARYAAGIFDGSGNLLAFSEDVGRHNALDKTIGLLVLERKHKEPCIVVLTSRLSYEMVQKVTRLNAEIIIGISSPTSLAVELARSGNITLIEFSRDEKGYIFTCPERVILDL